MANLIENNAIEQSDFTFQRISAQVERVLFSLDFIARHRFGVTLQDVYESQNERFGTCRRTAKRDISTMVAVGVVLVKMEDKKEVFTLNPAMKLGQLLLSKPIEENDSIVCELNKKIDELWELYLYESARPFFDSWDFWIECSDGRVVLIREDISYDQFVKTCNKWKLKDVRPFLSPRPLPPPFTVIHPED